MSARPDGSKAAPEGYLLCSRKDGTGARLSNLLWTWRLARASGLRTLCLWPPMDPYYGPNNGSRDLIDIYAMATGEVRDELQVLDARPTDLFAQQIIRPEPGAPCDPRRHAVWAGRQNVWAETVPVIDASRGPLVMEGEDPDKVREEASALFARLPLHPAIRNPLKHIAKAHRPGGMVAVHVRAGDIVDVLKDACGAFTEEARAPGSVLDRYTEHFFRACAPRRAYLRVVAPWLKKGFGILFFSDTPGAAHTFNKRFGSKVVLAQDLAPDGLNGIQQALFEMLLMSCCRAIIGAKSTFADLACVIGGTPFIDARRHASAEEFLGAYKAATRFDSLPPATRAGVSDVLVRKLMENGMLEDWQVDKGEVLRLMEAD